MVTDRDVVEAYANALAKDLDTLDALRHPDFVEEWPQSGERIVGPANMRAIDEHFVGTIRAPHPMRIVGSEDRWVMTPTFSTLRIEGSGGVYTLLLQADYPDTGLWYVTSFVELKDRKVWRVTTLFAQAFEPPAWRAAWVEQGERPG